MRRVFIWACLLPILIAVSCGPVAKRESGDAADNLTYIPVAGSEWPHIRMFTASADNITPGENISLVWDVAGTDQVFIDQGIGTLSSSGSIQIAPVKTAKYTLTASNNKGLAQAWVMITVAPLSSIMPDLIVTGVTQISGLLYYTITNAGAVDAGHSDTFLYDMSHVRRDTSWVESLKAGETRVLPFSNYDPRDTEIAICADGNKDVAEASEENNCFKGFGAILPDYHFDQYVSRMAWITSQGALKLPVSINSKEGSALKLPTAVAEDGNNYTSIMQIIPPATSYGWIQSQFGDYQQIWQQGGYVIPVEIPNRAHFRTKLGFQREAVNCYPETCSFGITDSKGNTEWWPGVQVSDDGKLDSVDIDLTAYSGQKCLFNLRVENGAHPQNCGILWIDASVSP